MPVPCIHTVIIYLITCLSLVTTACAQAKVSPDDKYDKQEAMILMRDGIKLHTVIYTPKGQKDPLPFLMERTPYGAQHYPGDVLEKALKNRSRLHWVKLKPIRSICIPWTMCSAKDIK